MKNKKKPTRYRLDCFHSARAEIAIRCKVDVVEKQIKDIPISTIVRCRTRPNLRLVSRSSRVAIERL